MENQPNPKFLPLLDLKRPWQAYIQAPGRAEHYEVRTEDGLILALRRVRPFGYVDAVAGVARPAVMLLHGLAANHRGFHFRGRSLAEWLTRRGFDVWLPELRGHGDSQFHGVGWRYSDYLRYDLPAIIATIQQHASSEKIHWIGHSMGGMLLMSYGILNPSAPIGQAIALGSALEFEDPRRGMSQLLKIRPAFDRLGIIPFRSIMRGFAPAVGRAVRVGAPFQVWPTNIEGQAHRELYANCFEDIPASLLVSLSGLLEPGGIKLDDGYCLLENGANFPFPLRILGGSRDAQVSAASVVSTARRLGPAAHSIILGPDSPGEGRTREHYGHWGFMVGKNAEIETWPLIAQWLENK
ncbi:alpha/beta fold hydrolase [Bradymonas sediminis]|nr:alpha/beta fold hydrolase [Bradymonas sediminis]TDP73868.1 alpha/beta hydrolase family protein [Bradymonas sediminis]